jgi:methylenetetrahydrofolate reductase (NADPH)
LSFELFPPKTPAGDRALLDHVRELMRFRPSFVTCTYGAGGSTRVKTLEIVSQVKERFGVPVASHLTCVGSSVDDLRAYLSDATARGIDHVVALRGDPPQGETEFQPAEGGLAFANELVTLVHSEFPHFGIAVAGYPEKHLEAPSLEADIAHLKRKVDAGADVVITQLFYNNADFLWFRERCRAMGIRVPIVPGILPVTNLAQVQRITAMCGAHLPGQFVIQLAQHDNPDWQFQVGVQYAIEQVRGLLAAGVPGLHFYVLNKSQAASEVLRAVALPDEADPQQVSEGGAT